MSINEANIYKLNVDKLDVMPKDSPTVEIAEITSKLMSK